MRYADDTTLLSGNCKDLKKLLMMVKAEHVRTGLQLIIKTQVMTAEKLPNFKADNEEIVIVRDLLFIGSITSPKGDGN